MEEESRKEKCLRVAIKNLKRQKEEMEALKNKKSYVLIADEYKSYTCWTSSENPEIVKNIINQVVCEHKETLREWEQRLDEIIKEKTDNDRR